MQRAKRRIMALMMVFTLLTAPFAMVPSSVFAYELGSYTSMEGEGDVSTGSSVATTTPPAIAPSLPSPPVAAPQPPAAVMPTAITTPMALAPVLVDNLMALLSEIANASADPDFPTVIEVVGEIDVIGIIQIQNNSHVALVGSGVLRHAAGVNRVVNVTGGSSLILDGVTITSDGTEGSGGVLVISGSRFIMESGYITDAHHATGGGVRLEGDGTTFIMNGGTITDNTVTGNGGAGVSLASNTTFIMNGGRIYDNRADATSVAFTSSGGVWVGTGSTFTMNGGVIEDNVSNVGAGGVRVQNGTFTMNNDSLIYDNFAMVGESGAGVQVSGNSGQFIMNNGIICSNSAGMSGGGVHVTQGSFVMHNGQIRNNVTRAVGGSGGGVHVTGTGSFTMHNGIIYNNRGMGGGGGGVRTLSTFTMNDGIIRGNYTSNFGDGGGVSVGGTGGFTMAGGSVQGNTTTGNGGGIFIEWDNVDRLSITEAAAANIFSNAAPQLYQITPADIVYLEVYDFHPSVIALFNNFQISYTRGAEVDFVPVTDITGVPTEATVNQALTLTSTVEPSDATNQTIIWSVFAPGTTGATIAGNVLTATAAGTVTVRATILNGLTTTTNFIEDFIITVEPGFVPVTAITGVPTTAAVNKALTLTGTVAPIDATNQNIVWSIYNPGTTGATISGNTLTATAAGTITVSATIINGLTADTDFTQNFTITVAAGVHAVTVTTQGSGSAVASPSTAAAGAQITLSATPNSGHRFVRWDVLSGGAVLSSTTASTATFTMPNNNVSVRAVFQQQEAGGNGGGGNGGGGGGGNVGGGNQQQQQRTLPCTTPYTVSSAGRVNLTLPTRRVTTLIDRTQRGYSIVFNMTNVSQATSVTIPREAVRQVGNVGRGLQFDFPGGSINFDAQAVASIGQQARGNSLIITLEPIRRNNLSPAQQNALQGIYDIHRVAVYYGNTRITNFDGTATITLPVTAQPTIWLLGNGGERTEISSNFSAANNSVTFSVYGLAVILVSGGTAPVVQQTAQPVQLVATGPLLRLVIGQNQFFRNGIPYFSDVAPFISTDDRTMVPLRLIAEALGAEVGWVEQTRTVTITRGGTSISLVIGEALPDGMGTAIIVDDRTLVPTRYVSEMLGATVRWDDVRSVVYIYR